MAPPLLGVDGVSRRVLPVLLVCAAAASARADGMYFTEGAGGTRVKNELSAYMEGAARFRIAIGYRQRRWALEGWVAGVLDTRLEPAVTIPTHPTPDGTTYPQHDDRSAGGAAPSLVTYGLDLKYLEPLSPHVEVYLRGGMSAADADGALDGWHGRGLGFGAGIQAKRKGSMLGLLCWPLFFTNVGPKMTGAIWLDSGYELYRLHGDRPRAIDAELTHLTFGFAVGSDF